MKFKAARMIAAMTQEQLHELQTEIRGEFARRDGNGLTVWRGGESVDEVPAGGALFRYRPAIGGDRDVDRWHPTIESANSELYAHVGNKQARDRGDGSLVADLTVSGCNESRAWTEKRSR